MFEGGKAVGVAAHQNSAINRLRRGVVRDVQAETHVDTFLLEHRLEVFVGEGPARIGYATGAEAAKLEDPTADSEQRSGGEYIQPFAALAILLEFAGDG